jgi:hypothetical protein
MISLVYLVDDTPKSIS